MRRLLFQWRGIKVYSYPAMLYLGLVLGVIAATYTAKFHGLNSARVYVAMLVLIAPALLGSRLLFVVTHWELFRRQPRRIWRRSDGGAALYGGLLLSLALSIPVLQALNVPIAGFWDMAAITILVGMVPTKFGCLLNGCCSGRGTTGRLGMYAPNEHGVWRRRLPAQLLEAALAVLVLIGSMSVQTWFRYNGILFLSAAIGYGIGRSWLETIRESVDMVGAWNLHRVISAALVVGSAISLVFIWFHQS